MPGSCTKKSPHDNLVGPGVDRIIMPPKINPRTDLAGHLFVLTTPNQADRIRRL